MLALVIGGREIQKKKQGHGPNPLSKNTIFHYQGITRLRDPAGDDSVAGLIRRARKLILSISTFDKDVATIRKGYLSDNAIKCSLEAKEKVHIIDSVVAKYYNSEGFLAAFITVQTLRIFLLYYISIPHNILLVFM